MTARPTPCPSIVSLKNYRDEYTNELLPKAWVQEAIHEELDYFNSRVWKAVPLDEALKEEGAKIIGCRWVMANKNDINDPDIRARLVAQEVGHHADHSLFASTPPLECKRMLFSDWATRRTHQGSSLKMTFIDVRKAYFYGTPSRPLYIRPPAELGMPKGMVMKLERCMYGCRDSGAIWENVYSEVLKGLGFTQAVASPCCFYHREKGISVVVHGDDFTALATDAGLDFLEEGMQKHFEVKLKGRIGHGDSDCKEMRVLNRLLRVVPEGLLYEPDPRHVEMLARAFDLTKENVPKPPLTPGEKPKHEETEHEEPEENLDDIVASLRAARHECAKVSFVDHADVSLVGAPEIPWDHELHGPIGSSSLLPVPKGCDLFTGVPKEEIRRRRADIARERPDRSAETRQTLERTLREGARWERSTAHILAAIPKKQFNTKRVGVRQAKLAEKMMNATDTLGPSEATDFRALAARANYLALDRPDIAYATKELCRCFAAPNHRAALALKRLVKYLVGKPRLVWRFFHQPQCSTLTTDVDTDVAGCVETRRPTSGGVALRGVHLLKHWSTTQSTVTLSSAEAELVGICKGTSIALGLAAVALDLGMSWDLKVRSDASAAIGVCRRRGLGRIRHLATADLWIQDRLRTGDFVLEKVLGSDNAADMLTKHLNRQLLEKHLSTLGVYFEEGRSELAPAIQHA